MRIALVYLGWICQVKPFHLVFLCPVNKTKNVIQGTYTLSSAVHQSIFEIDPELTEGLFFAGLLYLL